MKTSQTVFCGFLISVVLAMACAAPGQNSVNTPEGNKADYPPVVEDSAARQEEVQEAWRSFLAESNLPYSKLELEPVTNTPRSLPVALSGQISVTKKQGAFGEVEAKEAVRGVIERTRGILFGDPKNNFIKASDLSLNSFSDDGNFYRFFYQQVTYPFKIANGYGDLTIVVDKKGKLLQWSSRLLPKVELPVKPAIGASEIVNKLINSEFTYTTIAGQQQVYRVTKPEEVVVKDTVIFPKLEGNRLSIHLAISAEVGSGMTWTVYFDAIKGQKLGERQNFAS